MKEEGVFLGETARQVSQQLIEKRPEQFYKRSNKVSGLDWEEITKGMNSYIAKAIGISI
ncbi:hypothetical protein [Endozoicomonas sp. NE40]|uniref:Uncharacterized protein n=1 Tax=Endozoicomonas lisbonensis TaxID=3120522 RepID=A0ABV2SPF6_9GAMM